MAIQTNRIYYAKLGYRGIFNQGHNQSANAERAEKVSMGDFKAKMVNALRGKQLTSFELGHIVSQEVKDPIPGVSPRFVEQGDFKPELPIAAVLVDWHAGGEHPALLVLVGWHSITSSVTLLPPQSSTFEITRGGIFGSEERILIDGKPISEPVSEVDIFENMLGADNSERSLSLTVGRVQLSFSTHHVEGAFLYLPSTSQICDRLPVRVPHNYFFGWPHSDSYKIKETANRLKKAAEGFRRLQEGPAGCC